MKNISSIFTLLFCVAFLTNTNAQRLTGSGPIVTQDLDISNFTGVSLSFSGDVYLRQGDKQSVRVEGQQNLIDNLNTEINDGVWKLKFNAKNINFKSKFKVYITVPTLTYAKVSGSGNMTTQGAFTGLNDLVTGVSGSGDLVMDVECNTLSVKVSGSGDIEMQGRANAANIKVFGSGTYDGYEMKTQNCEASVTGSGDISTYASETLIASVTGSGDIDYKGGAGVKAKVTGSGDIDGH
ncbi:MAG: hypothetical protein ACI85O_002439 [Saprospiraceae bacterium]|jgi:hypothetical protein